MGKIDIAKKFLIDNAPAIFTGLSIVGTIATGIAAAKDTPAALDELDKAYLDKGEPLTKTEVFKATWKCYIPTAICGSATIAFIVCANYSHIRKETAMAATAAFFQDRYFDYKDKVIEIADEETDRQIESAMAKDKMSQNKPPEYLKRYLEEDGSFLCYEPITEQYFTANKTQLTWAEMSANKILQMEESVTLNQILALFPGVVSDKPIGDKYGWWMDDSYYEFIGYNWGYYGKPWMDLTPTIEEIDGQEVMVIHFSVGPVHEEAWDPEEMATYPDKDAERHMNEIASKYISMDQEEPEKPKKKKKSSQ